MTSTTTDDREEQVYRKQGFGGNLGLGRRPALLIVDFTNGFRDPDAFGGGNIEQAIGKSVGLLALFRELRLPVAHTMIVYADDGSDVGVFAMKIPALKNLTRDNPQSWIVPELTPRDGELVIGKTQASAFFGTGLTAWLTLQHVDSLVVAGCTTSGCVRASVVDAVSANFMTTVVSDCVGDRALGPHDANLFDMRQKYADVLPRDEVIRAIHAAIGGKSSA